MCNRHYYKSSFVFREGSIVRFDLADLSLFRHVVEAGSITHGAQRSNLALAAASTRMRNMEETLGVALLTRGRGGVTPTQAGRTLLQHFFFFQAEDGIRDKLVTGVQTLCSSDLVERCRFRGVGGDRARAVGGAAGR